MDRNNAVPCGYSVHFDLEQAMSDQDPDYYTRLGMFFVAMIAAIVFAGALLDWYLP